MLHCPPKLKIFFKQTNSKKILQPTFHPKKVHGLSKKANPLVSKKNVSQNIFTNFFESLLSLRELSLLVQRLQVAL